ncbi:MAG: hypothetical protein QNJ74_14400 [Trichodesmium sp. MO_231.B1]|nr:hypothetical protein [Trichodesmium sp. MO_231.B1]
MSNTLMGSPIVIVMKQKAALVKLKDLILQAKTANQLSAIIIDYTHEEIIQVYGQLTSKQQRKIKLIWQKCKN